MKNKIACLLIITIIAMFVIYSGAVFAADSASFDLTTNFSCINTGDQFIVTVNALNVTDLDAYEVNLTFDADKLGFIKSESGIQGGYTVDANVNGNNITMAFAKMGNAETENGNVTLCTFTFAGTAEGVATINLGLVKLMNGALAESKYIAGKKVTVVIGSNIVPVRGITVNSAGGATTITTKNGTLQMQASVLPDNATNKQVTWSVQNGTGSAIIDDSTGLLTAVSNGTVTVIATAADGSGIHSSFVITISGQASGSTTPTPTPKQSVTIGTQIITVNVQLDETGTASAGVKSDELQTAIDNSNGGVVKIEAQASEGAKELKVDIPAQQINEAGQKGVSSIDISTQFATVSFAPNALKDYIGSTSSNLQLSVAKVDISTLTEKVRQAVGNNPVYDFNMNVDGQKVSEFGANIIKVSMDYTLAPGEDPGNVIVYYINDNGGLEVVTNGRYDPVTGKVEFSPTHFSKYAEAYVNVTFNDISGVLWAKASIEALAARRVINGVGNNAFKPNDNVTRAEYIKMLMQAFDLVDESVACSLSDVKKGTWYYGSIATAQKLGIVKGKGDGSFGINDSITRQDMAVMTYRVALLVKAKFGNASIVEQFADKSDISAYALEAVETMQQAGIINGTGDGKFTPKGQTTRAQAATIIYRLYNIVT